MLSIGQQIRNKTDKVFMEFSERERLNNYISQFIVRNFGKCLGEKKQKMSYRRANQTLALVGCPIYNFYNNPLSVPSEKSFSIGRSLY